VGIENRNLRAAASAQFHKHGARDTNDIESAWKLKISMDNSTFTVDQFGELVRPLIGLPVTRPWLGVGCLFLELGALSSLALKRTIHYSGEANICVEVDWRVECEGSVLYGSSSSNTQIKRGIASLQGTKIGDLMLVGEVPELVAHFSNGHRLRSTIMMADDPRWRIKLPDGNYLRTRAGALAVDDGAFDPNTRDEDAIALAKATAIRWGTPFAEPRSGRCLDCDWFVPIDGDFHLLSYGACIASTGPFDGRVVHRDSGCPSFTAAKKR
jgi:hypothetical protein